MAHNSEISKKAKARCIDQGDFMYHNYGQNYIDIAAEKFWRREVLVPTGRVKMVDGELYQELTTISIPIRRK